MQNPILYESEVLENINYDLAFEVRYSMEGSRLISELVSYTVAFHMPTLHPCRGKLLFLGIGICVTGHPVH